MIRLSKPSDLNCSRKQSICWFHSILTLNNRKNYSLKTDRSSQLTVSTLLLTIARCKFLINSGKTSRKTSNLALLRTMLIEIN
jgi:hypothetical protein